MANNKVSNINDSSKSRYRVVAMIPTEMYIDAENEQEACGSMQWLFEQYPGVDAPSSDKGDNRMDMAPKILTIESA